VAYSIVAVTNATSYNWTLPTGATIASGAGTNSITVDYNTSASSGTISVVGVNACGNSVTPATASITVNPLPSNPGAITGSTTVCQGQSGVAYSITAVTNATSYTWTLPTGATIASGAGTRSITVNFSSSASSGTISVVGVNGCGNSLTPATASITVNPLPDNPGAITGTTTVCQGQSGVAYSIAAVTNATSYNWTLPSGASIASGAGTNSITVNYSTSASSGTISVVGVNACGNSVTPATASITVNPLPGAPGTISGSVNVCQGQAGVTYSIPVITNATSYSWTVPTGASIASGSGTNSITVDYGTSAISGDVTVFGVNGCGNSLSTAVLPVTVNPLPDNPGIITGLTSVCQGQSGVSYSTAAIPNATSYNWTLPAGASIVSGSGTNSITVDFGISASSGNVTVVGVNSCGTSLTTSSLSVSVDPLPDNPGVISGPTTVCQGQSGVTYSVTAVSNATSYNWTLPSGANIVSGTGTNSITVDYTTSALSGSISVVGVNACGNSPVNASILITVNPLPGNPGTITGPTTVCQGQSNVTYSIPAVANATSYSWTLPTGASIVSGSGTNSITVDYSTSALSGDVTVTGVNACGNSLSTSTLSITVNPLPGNPGIITGSTTVCQGQSGETYSILPVSDATSYNWTLPTGASIVSGSGTNSITVDFGTGAVSGNITVTGVNACGTSVASTSIMVTVNPLPGNPGTISGSNTVCQGQSGVVYSIAAVSDALSYNWTVPTGAVITAGTGTNSITVDYGTSAISGTVTVEGVNACGNSPIAASLNIVVNPLPDNPGAISGNTTVCQGQTIVTYSIATVTNATGYIWTVPTGASIVSGDGTNSITVDYGNLAISGDVTVSATNACGNSLTPATLTIIVNPLPDNPGPITGNTVICQGQSGEVYSIAPVLNATSYNWTLPSGASIVAGSGTESITVDFGASASSGTISVIAVNACGNSLLSSSENITVNVPPAVYAGKDDSICSNGDIIITDATAYDYSDIQWSVLTPLDGAFATGTDLTLTPVYIPGSQERQNGSVSLILKANSLTCGSITDTVKYTIMSELLTSIGSYSPYLVGPGTKIQVGVKIQNRLSVSDLGIYLVAPNGNSVRLTNHSIGEFTWWTDYCNFNTDLDAVFTSTLPVTDSADVCSSGLTGTFAAAGDWSSIYGNDPANGVWKLVVWDNDNMHGSGSDGVVNSFYIRFYDKNASGDSVPLLYNSGTINSPILEAQNAVTPISNTYTSSLELTTKCYDCSVGSGLGAMAVVSKTGGSGVYSRAEWYNVLDPTTKIATGDTVELCKGSYFAVVIDKYSCGDTAYVEVKSPLPISIDSVVISPNDTLVCVGATASVTAYAHGGTGTLKFTVDGKTRTTGVAATGITAGTYTVHIFDDNGCPKDTSITIVQTAAIAITDSSKVDIHCYGDSTGEVHVTATGGKLLKYQLWDAVTKTVVRENKLSPDFTGLKAGQYRVIVTDSLYGCSGDTTGVMNVTQPNRLSIDSLQVHNYSCTGANDGSILFYSVTGGTRAYSYSLDGSSYVADSMFTPLPATNYHVFVRDAWGCKDSADVVIINPSPIVIDNITFAVNDTLHCHGDKQDVTIFANNGGGALKYTYLGSSDTIPVGTPFNLGAGVFQFSVFEYAGACKKDTTVTIIEPDIIAISIDSTKNITCHGNTNGEIHVSATGANLLKYQLLDNASKTVIQENGTKIHFYNLPAGQYRVIASDSLYGCAGDTTSVITIVEPKAITYSLVTDSVRCYGEANGVITISGLNGGTVSASNRYSMSINGVNVGYMLKFSSLKANVTYSITVTDSLGCSLTQDTMVYQPVPLTIDRALWSSTKAISCAYPDGTITIGMPAGNPSTLEYSLDSLNWKTTNVFTGVPAKYPYTVYIRNYQHKSCVLYDTITVSGPYLKNPKVETYSPTCHNGDDGSIKVTNMASETIYYSLDSVFAGTLAANPNYTMISNVAVGKHTIYARNADFCFADPMDATVFDKPQIQFNYTLTYSSTDGKFHFVLNSISNATNPGPVTHTEPNGTITIVDLGVDYHNWGYGPHTLSVTDANGCSYSEIINKCLGINGSSSVTGVKCIRDTTGRITVSIDTAKLTPYLSYEISGYNFKGYYSKTKYPYPLDSTSCTFANLRPGSYSIVVLDEDGKCYSDYRTVTTESYTRIYDKDSTAKYPYIFDLWVQCNAYPYDEAHTWIAPGVIKDNKPVSKLWSTSDTTDSIYAGVGNYLYVITDNIGCSDTATYKVLASRNVYADAGPNLFICPLTTDTLRGKATFNTGNYRDPIYSYRWYADSTHFTLSNDTSKVTGITNTADNGFTSTVTLQVKIDEKGYSGTCINFDTTTITVYPKYGVEIWANLTTGLELVDTIIYGRNIAFEVLAAPDSFAKYYWSPTNYVVGADSLYLATFRFPEAGAIYLQAMTKEGCIEMASVYVSIPGAIVPPTGFTPNGDGINDVWVLNDAQAYPNIHVEVFNRWGSKVFQSVGYDNVNKVFDGKRNGKPLPTGTYYFIIDVGDGSKAITGSVTIVR
jgi:gliding motility-associated-like protein